ncbi:MAG: gamma-aminobutyrate permease, partial [Staphylococcus equorum]|nr:gamma-aminobutyrate permease [Staphylococcus equorum]
QFKSDIIFTLLNIIGSLVIVIWGSSILAQIRLRSAIKKQNKNPDDVLPYKAPFYPLGPIIVILALLFLFVGNSFGAVMAGDFGALFRNIFPMVILAIVYFSHKYFKKTKIVKLEELDLKSHDYS